MSKPLPISDALLGALRQNGVGVAHWKSNLHLPESLAGETDLDLLISSADTEAFRNAVAALNGKRIISQPWASYPGVEDWLVHDDATGGFLHLHVHYDLVTGLKRVKHLRLPWTATMLANLREDPRTGWPIPAAEMELLVLLIRIWAKMPPWRRQLAPRIPPHVVAELRWLESACNAEKFHSLAASLGLVTELRPPLANEAQILAAARQLYDQVRTHYRMNWPQALVQATVLNLRLAATRLWLKRIGPIRYRKQLAGRGAMIALIGSDGSGKSTQSRALLKWLHYKLDAHLLYMGSGDGSAGWLNRLRRSLSGRWRATATDASRKVIMRDSEKPASTAAKVWRLFDLMLLRRKLRLLRRGRRLADHGSVILLDRYPQDQFNSICDGPRQQDGRGFGWAADAERKLFAEAAKLGPDLVIKLHIDPATAHGRKPDHDIETIIRKCAIIDTLRFPMAEVVVIDAAAAPEAVLLAAKAAIWRHLREEAQR